MYIKNIDGGGEFRRKCWGIDGNYIDVKWFFLRCCSRLIDLCYFDIVYGG